MPPRGLFLQFEIIDDARTTLRRLDGVRRTSGSRWRDFACGVVVPAGCASESLAWWTHNAQEKEKDGFSEEEKEKHTMRMGGGVLGFGFGFGFGDGKNRVRAALSIGHVAEASRIQFTSE